MKFLLDQDVYAATVRFLRGLGHDVLTASEAGKATASDSLLLELARRSGRILVTRDRDFGSLAWVEGLTTGVIYLRIHSSLQGVHEELEAVLERYASPGCGRPLWSSRKAATASEACRQIQLLKPGSPSPFALFFPALRLCSQAH